MNNQLAKQAYKESLGLYNSGLQNSQCSAPIEQKAIPGALESLDKVIASIIGLMGELNKKLIPLKRSEPLCDATEKDGRLPEPNNDNISTKIDSQSRELSKVVNMLQDNLRLLEI